MGRKRATYVQPQTTGTARSIPRWAMILLLMSVIVLAALWFLRSSPRPEPETASGATAPVVVTPDVPEQLKVEVLSTRPHDPAAFTQGLVLDGDTLFESTGLNGRSSLREVDPKTGTVKRKLDIPYEYFAEGLALAGDRLIQLTWQTEKAFVYTRADFKEVGEFRYDGEGWGLCYDGTRLVMSDGSDRLTFRDPKTFAVESILNVTLSGQPARELNELECVDGLVYANVWQTDHILRIDPKTGRVTGVIDASGLLTPEERQKTDVLNGIAWNPKTKTFLITGKLWPKMFEVQFVPAPR